jgi:hypothetical protein
MHFWLNFSFAFLCCPTEMISLCSFMWIEIRLDAYNWFISLLFLFYFWKINFHHSCTFDKNFLCEFSQLDQWYDETMFLCDNMAFYSFVWIKRISKKNKTPQVSNRYMFEYLKRRKSNNFQTFSLYLKREEKSNICHGFFFFFTWRVVRSH